eukprot:TRINITY_DN5882_c0_g1_i1.p1 TRINITY_DN5882_c0_g1~~TRINITY_DN5882_c0_g1_i1.p1  ORF type:complete len:883 (-),score=132.47 TRINITY_DN5882_c0_g1_i1:260-2728(-)
MKINITEKCSQLVVNAAEIEVSNASLKLANGETIDVSSVDTDTEEQRVTFKLAKEAPTGDATMHFDFKAQIREQMHGCYRTSYTTKDGKKHKGVTTHFEPTTARHAFPCVDEPAHKAIFEISITAPSEMTVLSNAPEVSKKDNGDGSSLHQFADTARQCTYLIAWVVAEMQFIESKAAAGYPVRVYTPLERIEEAQFSLEVAVKSMDFYTSYFNVPYPLPKLDLIAIPDFPIGAMENWGCVTFVDSCIFVNEHTTTTAKQYVAMVVAHELCHMWFGNLVSLVWWDDLWLKEGFADFGMFLTLANIFPEWNGSWEMFHKDEFTQALWADQWTTTHAVEVPVAHPTDCLSAFDSISYQKGCCICKMAYDFLTEPVFKEKIHNYLSKYSFSNTITLDLWDELQLADVMPSYTSQPGYPIVHVTQEMKDKTVELKIKQERFYGCGTPKDAKGQLWVVPLTIKPDGNDSTRVTLKQEEETITAAAPNAGNGYAVVNYNRGTLLRVHNDDATFQKLGQAVKDNQLSQVDSAAVLSDALAMSRSGVMPATKVLDLLLNYCKELRTMPCKAMAEVVGTMSGVFRGEEFAPLWAKLRLKLFSHAFETLGWDRKENETVGDGQVRTIALDQLGYADHQGVIKTALEKFNALADGGKLDSDLWPVILPIVSANFNDKWDGVVEYFVNPLSVSVKKSALAAAGQTGSDDNAKKLLKWALEGEKIRRQDARGVFVSVGNNSAVSVGLAWEFMKENWAEIDRIWSVGLHLRFMIQESVALLLTSEAADDVEKFFQEHPCRVAKSEIARAVEIMRTKVGWKNRDEAAVKEWLKANVA